MSRVVFATDLSAESGIAERLIGTVAWPAGTSFLIVTVVPSLRALSLSPWVGVATTNVAEIEANRKAWAECQVSGAAGRLSARGLNVAALVLRGPAAAAIVDVATREGADLIVMGSRGLGAIDGALLGSVSEAVVDRAPCPVLVARRDRLERCLIADDASQGAELALDYVRRRPHLLGQAARLVDVERVDDLWPEACDLPFDAHSMQVLEDGRQELLRMDEADLQRDAAALHLAHIQAETQVVEGAPGPAIVDTAGAWDADLVVVGSRHRRGITRLLMGSVGAYVLHHAACSVLVVGCTHVEAPAAIEMPGTCEPANRREGTTGTRRRTTPLTSPVVNTPGRY